MGDQEINSLQNVEEEDSICRSMLHLSTVCDHHPAAAATITGCGNSAKRQSSLFRSQLQEPHPKRATLHHPSSPSTPDHDLLGFKKLTLPTNFAAAAPPPLRRTLSEPIYSPGTVDSAAAPPKLSDFPTSPAPIKNRPRPESSPFQEPAPSLNRTISDPNPVFTAATPPRPPARKNASRSPSCGESPSTKRLRRMKERLREMSQWWNQVASEDEDDENFESANYCTDNDPREECEERVENPSQEAVYVEKKGECVVLHFRCPCGDGYQILLSGNNCYYKLTTFRNGRD